MTTTEHPVPVDILLVDDRAENLLALEAILEPLGQHLVRARSGEEALRCLLDRDFAVILLDVQMPGLNGFETAQLIKSRERTKFIPIIFLTAISKDDEYVFQGYSVGAVDYMFKPFQPAILRSKVQVFVDLYLQQLRITEQEQRLRDVEVRELELRHMHELVQSDARFREIVGSAMDAIMVFDSNGVVTLVNGAAERMFGAKTAEAVGKEITRFFPTGMSTDFVTTICATAEAQRGADKPTSAVRPTSLTGCRANGETFPIEASVSCLDTANGRTYTLIARDISERVRHEEELKQQADSLAGSAKELQDLNEELHRRQLDLERAMTARSRFYASMSHELRTPINAVLGYSTLLLERIYGPLNDKQAEGIERTQKAARHLLELVNDVLDLSKIEAGKIDLRLQPVEFPSLIEDLFITVRPLADEHGSALALTQSRREPIKIISDPRRVRQILLNLLSNAIKFGRGLPINVMCTATDDDGVLIEVTDHGDGISAEDQERIFHEFVQLGKTQLQDGTGLGLPISRRLAELLRGSLSVESTLGSGSTFRLQLPASAESRPVRLVEQEAPRDTTAVPVSGD
ncbi:MAG: ATP-binding region ATPase domain protein [Gemmatimonadetes bacterium]|nr:ATP-binding region ATPase domain protein [Gemmatimonadota bacterium]